MKRLLALTAALAAIPFVGPGAASSDTATSARYVPGNYSGRTSQGLPISFRVSRSAVSRLAYRSTARCSDGVRRTTPTGPLRGSLRIRRDRFSGGIRSETFRLAISGRLSGRRGSGSFRELYSGQNAEGEQVTCDSGVVRFSVRRR